MTAAPARLTDAAAPLPPGAMLGEQVGRDRRLNVSGLGLHALVADGGIVPQLIGHAATLAAHAQATGLGGIAQRQLAQGAEGVEQFFRAATDDGGVWVLSQTKPAS